MDTHILVTHSSLGEQLACFYLLATMKKAAINVGIQGFVWMYVFCSPEYIPKSGSAGLYGNYV